MSPEAIAEDPQLAFGRFCGLLQVPLKEGGGRVPFQLSCIQTAYCVQRTDRDIILKPRQVWITTLECARDLWYFLTKRGAHVLVVCQSVSSAKALREIAEKFEVFFDCLSQLGLQIPFGRDSMTEWSIPSRDATLRMIQAGGSKVAASKKGRAGTINRLHISEAAFFDYPEESFKSIMGSVSDKPGVEVVIESTPNGRVGWYYEQWQGAVDGRSLYTPHFFPWWLHEEYRRPLEAGEVLAPQTELEQRFFKEGVPPEAIKWYRWKLAEANGDERYMMQEFPSDVEGCFLDADQQYVPPVLVEQATVLGGRMPVVDGFSYAGLDIGLENDLSSLVTVKVDRYGHAWVNEVLTTQRTDWDAQMAMILSSGADWQWVRLCVDSTGLGLVPARMLQKALGRERVELVNFDQTRKSELVTELYARFANRGISLPADDALRRDICSLRRVITQNGKVTFDAPRSAAGHADRAWGLALALRACSPLRHRGGRRDYGPGDYGVRPGELPVR